MNTIARLKAKHTKNKAPERYCGVYESLEESLKEVKLIKEGKIKPKSWRDIIKEIKEDKE